MKLFSSISLIVILRRDERRHFLFCSQFTLPVWRDLEKKNQSVSNCVSNWENIKIQTLFTLHQMNIITQIIFFFLENFYRIRICRFSIKNVKKELRK
jgi:hypothetical protein